MFNRRLVYDMSPEVLSLPFLKPSNIVYRMPQIRLATKVHVCYSRVPSLSSAVHCQNVCVPLATHVEQTSCRRCVPATHREMTECHTKSITHCFTYSACWVTYGLEDCCMQRETPLSLFCCKGRALHWGGADTIQECYKKQPRHIKVK